MYGISRNGQEPISEVSSRSRAPPAHSSISRFSPALLRELALLKGYIRNPGTQEARKSGSWVTPRSFSAVALGIEARRPFSPTF